MKRLKYFFLQMEPNTSTYRQMYEGHMLIEYPDPDREPEVEYDNTYWYEDLAAVTITTTHKLAQDKPTLTWKIPLEKLGVADLPASVTRHAADYCLRAFAPYVEALNEELYNRSRTDEENGKYYLCKPGGEVLTRNASCFAVCPQKDYVNGRGSTVQLLDDGIPRSPQLCLCIRMQVQLPRKRVRKAMQMLCRDLPQAIERFLMDFDTDGLQQAIALGEQQTAIRAWLRKSDCCAFLANGSILPRAGETDLPLPNAVPFQSTPEDEIEVCGVRGMGVRRGVTVITGGGYSGKSTLLDAISAGIYDHVAGDGRELCITDDTAMTLSAEDGRSVRNVNISPFIRWLPGGDTRIFSTDHASGSTSQAANVMEAVDRGSRLLLIDEDRSATNFMIRDRLMKELIEKEPIVPFTDRVQELSREKGISTVLVIGGSGEYLSVADRVYIMDDFLIRDGTEQAKMLCHDNMPTDLPSTACWEQHRALCGEGFSSYPTGSGSERLEVLEMGILCIGNEQIDIRGLHDLITPGQLHGLGFLLRYLEVSSGEPRIDLKLRIDALYDTIEREGLDFVYSSFFTTCERFFDLPRKCELLAVINRMRTVRFLPEKRAEG